MSNRVEPRLILPVLLLLAGAATRLPGLAEPDRVVWDEECFGAAAARYLTGEMSLEFHPPLGKLLIALGLHLVDADPSGSNFAHESAYPGGYPAWAGRLVPALAGALLPWVLYLVARALSMRPWLAFLAGVLAGADSALAVECRFQLINAFVPLFGFLAILGFLRHAAAPVGSKASIAWLLASALAAGAAVSVKWTGGAALLVVGFATLLGIVRARGAGEWAARVAVYTLVPVAVYIASFAVHFALLTRDSEAATAFSPEFRASLDGHGPMGFWGKLVEQHRAVGRIHRTYPLHPNSSAWYTWPVMGRYIAIRGPKVDVDHVIVLVGNPIVWGFGAAATLGGLGVLLWRRLRGVRLDPDRARTPAFLLLLYASNWLPFALVGRDMFAYHYLSAMLASVLFGLVLAFGDEERPTRWAWCLGLASVGVYALMAPLVYGFPGFPYLAWAIPALPLLALIPRLPVLARPGP